MGQAEKVAQILAVVHGSSGNHEKDVLRLKEIDPEWWRHIRDLKPEQLCSKVVSVKTAEITTEIEKRVVEGMAETLVKKIIAEPEK